MKTPNQTSGYYAVRKGLKNIRSCLFLNWEDCQAFVDESPASEYQVFAQVEEAVAYLRARSDEAMDQLTAPLPPPVADDATAAAAKNVAPTNQQQPSRSPARAAATASSTKETSATATSREDARLLASAAAAVVEETLRKRKTPKKAGAKEKAKATTKQTSKRRGRSLPSNKPPEKRRRVSNDKTAAAAAAAAAPAASAAADKANSGTDQQEKAQKTRMRRPTKSWEAHFARLEKLYEEKDQDIETENEGGDDDDQDLQRWIVKQREHYRALQKGKPSSMYDEKITRLRSIGFEFEPKKKKDTPTKKKIGTPKRNIYKKWRENYDTLKEYSEAHDGSCDISKDDEEHIRLREWVRDQELEYKKLMDGKETRLTQEKLQLLREIGCEFEYVTWNERLEQLKAYKEEFGDYSVPRRHEGGLGKWVESLLRMIRNHQEGKQTKEITKERLAQLKEIGFDPTIVGTEKKKNPRVEEQANAAWEEKFAMLQEFKRQHGHCKVTRTEQDVKLHSWVLLQRRNYQRLQDGKPSKLTAVRLMRLNEIGFQFSQKGRYQSWGDRLEKLKQYKEVHGHVNVPLSNEELGEFVSRQRTNYRSRQAGESSPLTDERLRLLQELGFNFDIGPKKDKSKVRAPPKTWDERYQDLLEFQEAFGHTVVPQHSQWNPGLGSWVKAQRCQFKLMGQGKKSSMTPEKALRLSNIGFKFEVLDSNRRRISVQPDGPDESDDDE